MLCLGSVFFLRQLDILYLVNNFIAMLAICCACSKKKLLEFNQESSGHFVDNYVKQYGVAVVRDKRE